VGLLRKPRAEVETKAAKRIANLSTPELPPQVEHCLYIIGKSLADFGHDGSPEHVLDALGAAEISVEILRELKRRME
jgi:hypothetical protein